MPLIKTEQKKLDILEYASLRFGKYGVAKTTIDELSKDMRMGKASLYHYFSSKEDLYYQAINFESGRLLAKVKETFNNDSIALPDKLKIYFNLKTDIKKQHRILYNLFNLIINDTANTKEKELAADLINKESGLIKSILSAYHPDDHDIEDRDFGLFFSLLSFTALYPIELLNLFNNDKKKEIFGANFSILIEKLLSKNPV